MVLRRAWRDVRIVLILLLLSGIDGIMIYKSTIGSANWSAPNRIDQSIGDDRQWAAGDGNPASTYHGNAGQPGGRRRHVVRVHHG
jgi:hypothetical protein